MVTQRYGSKSSAGFSLVEIMVGLVISMVAVLAIMQALSMFEAPRRAAIAASDAHMQGGLAMYTLERDVRMAGYGLSLPALLGCTLNSSYNGATPTAPSPLGGSFILAPLIITKGANGLPDTIRVVSSAKRNPSVPARVVTDHPSQGSSFFLNTVLGIAPGDMMIAYEPGKNCALFQVTDIPTGNVQVNHTSAGSRWNPAGSATIFPTSGYTTDALLFNMGSFSVRTYSVDSSANLLLSDYTANGNANTDQQLFPDIVSLKAQYGFDTRPAGLDAQVDAWRDTVIDADGNGTAGDTGDLQRMYAARIAVVARSAEMEKPLANGSCDNYTRASPVLVRPTWTAADPATGVLRTTTIDVSKNPDGTANALWQCYRYKVFETVIPLRNQIWGKS
ncbi:PilW family protein [Noviherbaspirillum suwonense]|jgi:type IV pilus assembly protein PilW|uniref:Type IV pilus assembly protein PilW n=1 Tax=Noviherbaspirillum suwonense TaxID=1224511 RepID=A0ABY1PYS8_9BURK|nr:PilW family protein [Noviherbaspirillum suwonense]SMP53337.1 type IV pilus assembly protein PilW [Noviherbaspirillum suwonense]